MPQLTGSPRSLPTRPLAPWYGAEPLQVAVVGAEHAGIVHAAALTYQGHRVQVWDADDARLQRLRSGSSTPFEPGLDALIARGFEDGVLELSATLAEAVADRDLVLITVPGGSLLDGGIDLAPIERTVKAFAPYLTGHTVLVLKTTVPVGAGEQILGWVRARLVDGATAGLAVVPDFFRRGGAVMGALAPERVVIGADDDHDALLLYELYAPLECPIILSSVRSAELSRLAATAFLATKFAFINAMSGLCEQLGADVSDLGRSLGLESREGQEEFQAGLGPCETEVYREAMTLLSTAHEHGLNFDLLRGALAANHEQVSRFMSHLRARFGDLAGLKIGALGLTSQPNSEQFQNSPALRVIRTLLAEGASVRVYDPAAAAGALPDLPGGSHPNLFFERDAYQAATKVDALLLLTEWPEFLALDFERLADRTSAPVLFDAHNFLPIFRLRAAGFEVHGVGRAGGRFLTPSLRRRTQRSREFALRR